MLDEETYKKEIVRMWDTLRADEYKGERSCKGIMCRDCPLSVEYSNITNSCANNINAFTIIKKVEKWSEEHHPLKLTRLEYDILKYLSDNTEHIYITRDEYNCVYLFDEKPKKSSGHWYGLGACSVSVLNKLFQFVQWEDKEPTLIQDVLENCEVLDDDD